MNKKLAMEEEEMEDEIEQSVLSSSVVSSYDKTQQRKRCRPNNFYNQKAEDKQEILERQDEIAKPQMS